MKIPEEQSKNEGSSTQNVNLLPKKPENTTVLSQLLPNPDFTTSSLLGATGGTLSANNTGISQPIMQPANIDKTPLTNPLPSSLASMVTSMSSIVGLPLGIKNSTGKARNISAADPVKLISKRRLQELVSKIDPSERLDPEAEDILLEIADEFIESVTQSACRLAKHRKSQTLEVKDVQLHLERNWNIRIPGYANDEIRTIRRVTVPTSHINKLAAVNSAKASSNGSNPNHTTQASQEEPAGEKL